MFFSETRCILQGETLSKFHAQHVFECLSCCQHTETRNKQMKQRTNCTASSFHWGN